MEFFLRIKKYLFLLAFVISIVLGIHVIIVYLYDEAEMVAERGGTFSIGATGASPSLNPTQYTLDTLNDFALRFLYRGLLKYNPENRTMEGDLANCDIAKSLGEIRCFFKTGAVWSDGSKITVEDALATYSLLAETDTNKRLRSQVSGLQITREDTALVFRSTNPSIETLQLLTIPVIKKTVSERIRNEGRFQEEAYSGPYQLEKRESDGVRLSENISLIANNDSLPSNDRYSRIVLRVFGDKPTLVAQKDSLNLVFPGYYDDESMGQRFDRQEILTPDFVGAFINSERITPERRRVLSGIIHQLIEKSESKLKPIKNPFLTDSMIVSNLGENIDAELLQVGYLRKKDLPKTETPPAPVVPVTTPPVVAPQTPAEPAPTPVVPEVEPEAKTLQYIDTPSKNPVYANTAYQTEILVGGSVPKGVTGVLINGYRLKGYTVGQTRFTYRARTEIGNLKKGTNRYELAFERNGKKETMETIEIHNGDGFVIPAPKPAAVVTPAVSPSTSAATGASTSVVPASMAMATGTTNSGTTAVPATSVSTGTTTAPVAPPKKDEPAIDDKKLYFKNGTPVKLVVRSLSPKTEISDVSKDIVTGLENLGFEVQFEEVESSSAALGETKSYEGKNYDVFITGVNLGYLGTYLMPYFHSGQVQNGFNFSLLRNPALDILLEELKTRDLPTEGRTRAFEKINDILRKEAVLVPIGTSPLVSYIDKNIQQFTMPGFLPSAVFIDNAILRSYINKTYIVQFEKKSIRGFFEWCTARLSPKE